MPFSFNRLPAKAKEASQLGALAWPAVVSYAVEGGLRDADYLTDAVFFLHHPERLGKPIEASEKSLISEWKFWHKSVQAIIKEHSKSSHVAVLIVPNQGSSSSHFLGVARALDREVYDGKALVLKASLSNTSATGVKLTTDRGGAFSWGSTEGLKTVMTISHGGPCDGPNLDRDGTGEQPWKVSEGTACTDEATLSKKGTAFWRVAGNSLGSHGKVILLGCHMGEGEANYARVVANATGKTIFAANNNFAAGSRPAALKHVRQIEAGKQTSIFKRF